MVAFKLAESSFLLTWKSGLNVEPAAVFLGDAAHLPLKDGSISVVVTDPPYFDEISYADLSVTMTDGVAAIPRL